jgi:hypothetical protein
MAEEGLRDHLLRWLRLRLELSDIDSSVHDPDRQKLSISDELGHVSGVHLNYTIKHGGCTYQLIERRSFDVSTVNPNLTVGWDTMR